MRHVVTIQWYLSLAGRIPGPILAYIIVELVPKYWYYLSQTFQCIVCRNIPATACINLGHYLSNTELQWHCRECIAVVIDVHFVCKITGKQSHFVNSPKWKFSQLKVYQASGKTCDKVHLRQYLKLFTTPRGKVHWQLANFIGTQWSGCWNYKICYHFPDSNVSWANIGLMSGW